MRLMLTLVTIFVAMTAWVPVYGYVPNEAFIGSTSESLMIRGGYEVTRGVVVGPSAVGQLDRLTDAHQSLVGTLLGIYLQVPLVGGQPLLQVPVDAQVWGGGSLHWELETKEKSALYALEVTVDVALQDYPDVLSRTVYQRTNSARLNPDEDWLYTGVAMLF